MKSLWEVVLEKPLETGAIETGPDLCRVSPLSTCGALRACTALEAVWSPLEPVSKSLEGALPTTWHCPLWIAQQLHGALANQAAQQLTPGATPGTAGWQGLPSGGDRMQRRRPSLVPETLWGHQPWPELWERWTALETVWWEWVGVDPTGTTAWVVGMRESGAWVAVEGLETARGWVTAQVIQQPNPRLIYQALPQGPWGWTSRDEGDGHA